MRLFVTFQHSMEQLSATRINGQLGLVADVGISIALLGLGLRSLDVGIPTALCIVAAGVFAFSFAEYCFHRWLFHGSTPVFEQGHERHHEEPVGYDSLPFFLAPLAIALLAALLCLVLTAQLVYLFAGGFAAGYAVYGLSHTAIHRLRFRNALARRWAAAHHIHHRHPGHNFGVTTPLWDIVLGTRYERQAPRNPV